MTELSVPIVTPLGESTKSRKFVNTPMSVLYPDERPILIDWQYDEMRKKPTARTVEDERDCIAQPLAFGGVEYTGYWGWGSGVKVGETFGLTHDIGWETNMMRYVEDGQRFQRWLMCQGWYGLDYRPMKIKILPEKTMTKWGQVADGFGYFARPPLNDRDPIKLGRSRGSYTFWQRLIMTPDLWDELKPLIDERILNISHSVATFLTSGHSLDYKAQLVDINPEMVEHPFVSNVITDNWGEYMRRVATTAPIKSNYRLAVPADPSIEFIESGDPRGSHLIVARYPLDSYGNEQAVESEYSERIAQMECIQYSLSSNNHFLKGCGMVVDNLDGFDAVLCNKDLKMASGTVDAIAALDETIEDTMVFAITQHYAPGTAIGVNVDWFKKTMGGDQDGDGVEVTIADGLPHLWDAVKALPYGESPKLPKIKRLLKQGDYRPEMIEQSMQNLVGFASNVTAQVLAKENQASQAYLLGFESETVMHDRLNYAIKMGTDGFKTNIDPTPIVAMLTNVQAKLAVDEVNPAPWCSWGDKGTDAFKWYVPTAYDRLYAEDGKLFGMNDGIVYELDDEHFNMAVSREYHTGCVGKIASYVLPQIVDLLGEGIKHQQLTFYRHWSYPDQDYIPAMKIIKNFWNYEEHDINWSNPDEIVKLKGKLKSKVDEVIEDYGLDRWVAANTLWTIAHSARSLDNQAAVVFLAFPEECLSIALLKPGELPGKFETTLTGLDYQLPGFASGVLECEIRDVDVISRGKHVTRKALISMVEGQKQPQAPYPENMVALVAINAAQPRAGKYLAEIVKVSEKGWRCLLNDDIAP